MAIVPKIPAADSSNLLIMNITITKNAHIKILSFLLGVKRVSTSHLQQRRLPFANFNQK